MREALGEEGGSCYGYGGRGRCPSWVSTVVGAGTPTTSPCRTLRQGIPDCIPPERREGGMEGRGRKNGGERGRGDMYYMDTHTNTHVHMNACTHTRAHPPHTHTGTHLPTPPHTQAHPPPPTHPHTRTHRHTPHPPTHTHRHTPHTHTSNFAETFAELIRGTIFLTLPSPQYLSPRCGFSLPSMMAAESSRKI